MTQVLGWLDLFFTVIGAWLVLCLWRTYRRKEPVAPQMYLFTLLCSLLFLGIYVYMMPAGQWVKDLRFAGPAAGLGLLWGMASARGMVLFRHQGHDYLKGSVWVPLWTTLNFAGGKFLEQFGPGLWGVGALAVMMLATMATVGANLVLLVTLVRVRRFYEKGPRKGGKLHFCHACGTGFERAARRCPACGTAKARPAS